MAGVMSVAASARPIFANRIESAAAVRRSGGSSQMNQPATMRATGRATLRGGGFMTLGRDVSRPRVVACGKSDDKGGLAINEIEECLLVCCAAGMN